MKKAILLAALLIFALPTRVLALPGSNQIEFNNCSLALPGTNLTASARCGSLEVAENPAELRWPSAGRRGFAGL